MNTMARRKQPAPYADLIAGEMLFQQRARIALPILIRYAKAGHTISYKSLANELGMSFALNLNFVLGFIGNALLDLEEKTQYVIPRINCLVVSRTKGIASEGVDSFIDLPDRANLSRDQLELLMKAYVLQVCSWEWWDWVLAQLGLEPLEMNILSEMLQATQYGGSGESPQHKAFREWLAKNPAALGLRRNGSPGRTEFGLSSADQIDIVFKRGTQKIVVEVKSSISKAADILRGMFQCIKYKALMEAEQVVLDERRDCRAILALQGSLPQALSFVRDLLQIEVIDNISMRPKRRNHHQR
jgi:hypothetical protein